MSYQKDRDEFVGVIVEECTAGVPRLGPHGGNRTNEAVDLARLVLRNAATIQRLAILDCNSGLTDGQARAKDSAEQHIETACKLWGIKPMFDGDPRGCCVHLLLPSGRWNSLGGEKEGFRVPVR